MTRALTPFPRSSSRAWRASFSFSTMVGIRTTARPALRHSAATRSDRLRESSIGKQSRLTAMMPRRTLGVLCMVLLLLLSVVSLGSVLSPEVLLQDVAVKRREVSIEDGRGVGHLGHVLEDEGGLARFLRGPGPGGRPAPGGG